MQGMEAMKLLLKMINGEDVKNKEIIVPSKLILRGSEKRKVDRNEIE